MRAHFNLLAIAGFMVEENFNSFLKLHAFFSFLEL